MLAGDSVAVLATPEALSEIAAIPAAKRTAPQQDKLSRAFRSQYAPEEIKALWNGLVTLREERDHFWDSLPTVMVMAEMENRRDTLYSRAASTTSPPRRSHPAYPRCSLLWRVSIQITAWIAAWIVDPSNPLTARVAVNRMWQMLFGVGLVKTAENFGSQGEWPSHPALLDWLATEYVSRGWDTKALLKLIVTSATYRQSSKATPESLEKDPENRLIARGPRFGVSPEMVRDQALASRDCSMSASEAPR